MASNPFTELARFDELCRRHGSVLDLTDEEMVDALMTGETDLKEIAEALIADLDELEVQQAGLKTKIDEFSQRKLAFDGQAERVRAVLFKVLERMPVDAKGKRSLKLPTATLTYKAGTPKVVVTCERDVPFDLMRKKPPEPDLKAILDELKAGVPVPGAQLSNGVPSLQIRRK